MSSPPTTSSLSVTQTINESHSFTIKGYSLAKRIEIGKHIASDTFTVDGYQWAIYFYHDGKNPEDNSAYVSVFIALASNDTDVRALFELSLLDQSGKGNHKVHSHFDRALESDPYTLKYRGSMWGYKRFLEDLLESSDFLKDDCLKINCTVRVVVSEIDCPRLHSIHVHASDIGSHFGMLLENEDGSYITFNVSGEKFRAHRLVLAARSPVFESEFLDVTGEEDCDIEVKPKVFKALLHYIYKDALIEDAESSSSSGSSVGPSASDTLAAKLLGVADKYKLPRLSLMCESVLCKDISIEFVANILALVDRHNASALKAVCLKFAAENLIAIMRSDGFDYLREHCPLLQSELLKTFAGCEDELSGGGGKTRSVWGQYSDCGAETNERSRRQQQTWGDVNGGGGAERSQSVWVQVVNANASGRNNNENNNNSDDPMAED